MQLMLTVFFSFELYTLSTPLRQRLKAVSLSIALLKPTWVDHPGLDSSLALACRLSLELRRVLRLGIILHRLKGGAVVRFRHPVRGAELAKAYAVADDALSELATACEVAAWAFGWHLVGAA